MVSYVFFGVATSVAALFYLKTMDNKEITAVFIGNRDCYFIKENHIEQAIVYAINMGISVFLNGGMGYFDITCAKVVKKMKSRYPQIKCNLIIPYLEFTIPNKDLYDEIIYPLEKQSQTYFFYKRAIPERNRIMVEKSSVAICYVYRAGGASKTLDYAKRKELKIIDIIKGE